MGTPAKECLDFVKPYNGIGKALTGFSLDLSWITALTTHYDPVPIPPDAYGPQGRPGKSGKTAKTNTTNKTATAGTRSKPGDLSALLPGGGR